MLAELYVGLQGLQNGNASLCRQHMVAAKQLAKELDLMPFALAAEDAINSLDVSSAQPSLLRHRMQNRSIQCPELFERTYTVAREH